MSSFARARLAGRTRHVPRGAQCPSAGYSELTRLSPRNQGPCITAQETTVDDAGYVQDMNRTEPTTPLTRPVLTRPRQYPGRRRRLPLVLAALSSALALAACGASSKPRSAVPSSASNGSPSDYAKSQLAAAKCIRKHGVPNFPDPTFGAGGAQVNLHAPLGMLTSPGFELAQKQCAKLGLELAGSAAQSQTPSAATMAQMLAIAHCMRAHGVPNFPDPAKTMPSDPATYPARYDSVADMNGVVWAIPKSIDLQAPAVKQAAAACGGAAGAVISVG